MVVPSVMFLEEALEFLTPDALKNDQALANQLVSQEKELMELGDARVQELGASGLSRDFIQGYQLGVQVMRVLLMQNMTAIRNNIDI